MSEAVLSGHTSGDGPFTQKCHRLLEQWLGVPKVLLTTSCTHALEMSALLLNIQPGDEVIVPAFTFVSTVNAFVLRGAHPVFIDIRPDTLNLDEALLERLITPRTKAIVLVHYAGIGCEMDATLAIAQEHNVAIVEDNAHGLFGRYKGKFLGTFGMFAAQSFHETKNFTCGEGGALLINDPQYVEHAEIIREKGTNRSRFFRGQVDKYTWVDIGSSYLPSDVLAAFLYAQLESREQVQNKRRQIWEYYNTHLNEWAQERHVRLPIVPPYCEQPYHMYYLLMPSLDERQSLIGHLKAHGILAVFHYLPLHLSEMGKQRGGKEGDCPVTEDINDRLLRLPFYNDLTESDLAIIVSTIKAWNDQNSCRAQGGFSFRPAFLDRAQVGLVEGQEVHTSATSCDSDSRDKQDSSDHAIGNYAWSEDVEKIGRLSHASRQ
jgi:dTDP-4-amino-4,6-dideoxygalactose transaminase